MIKRFAWIAVMCGVFAASAAGQTTVTTSGGTTNAVPVFSGTSAVGSSIITQANGDIGIGTSNPQGKLEVDSSGQGTANLLLDDASTGNHFVFLPNAGSGYANPLVQAGDQALIYSGSGEDSGSLDIVPWSATAKGIRINSAGNVGIGTSSPAANLNVATSSGTTSSSFALGANGAPSYGQYFFNRTDQGTGDGIINFLEGWNGSTVNWQHGSSSGTVTMMSLAGNNTGPAILTLNGSMTAGSGQFTGTVSGTNATFSGAVSASSFGIAGWSDTNGIGGAINSFGGSSSGQFGLDLRRWTGNPNIYNNVYAGQWLNNASSFYDFGIFENVTTSNTQATTLVFDVAPTGVAVTGTGTFTSNVGIGTVTPGAKLEVNGNVKLSTGSGASITFPDNTVQATAWNGTTFGGDYAEAVDLSGEYSAFSPGDVLTMDSKVPGKFVKTGSSYSTLVAGIYSTKPGLVGRRQSADRSADATAVPMAMIGIVPTKVTAENGPIKTGDMLVTSSTAGYAMKGTDRSRLIGAIVGKAIGELDSGTGVIEVLVTLQ